MRVQVVCWAGRGERLAGHVSQRVSVSCVSTIALTSGECFSSSDKQAQGNVLVYRAVCLFLSIICLVLLLVVVILCMKREYPQPLICHYCWKQTSAGCREFTVKKSDSQWQYGNRTKKTHAGLMLFCVSSSCCFLLPRQNRLSRNRNWGQLHSCSLWLSRFPLTTLPTLLCFLSERDNCRTDPAVVPFEVQLQPVPGLPPQISDPMWVWCVQKHGESKTCRGQGSSLIRGKQMILSGSSRFWQLFCFHSLQSAFQTDLKPSSVSILL